jgi:uncharacterized protein YecE (DUF72 family)
MEGGGTRVSSRAAEPGAATPTLPGVATAVAAAAPGQGHEGLAARLPPGVRFGTSSWAFVGWAGIVYGESRDGRLREPMLSRAGLSAYARHPLLRAVGVDRSHYAPMSAENLAQLAAGVPPDFRFLVKAWEELTLARFPAHARYGARRGDANSRFLDPSLAADAVVAPYIEGLAERGGCLLFEFAPQPIDSLGGPVGFANRIGHFLRSLPRGPLYAVEIRDPRLLTRDYAQALASAGAVHCVNLLPFMPSPAAQATAAPLPPGAPRIVRWMLAPGRRYEEAKAEFAPFDRLVAPDPEARDAVAALAADAVRAGRDALVIVNNKAEGSAPLSCFALAEALVSRLARFP